MSDVKNKADKRFQKMFKDSKTRKNFIWASVFELILGLIMIFAPEVSSGAVGYIIGAAFLVYGIAMIVMFIMEPLFAAFGIDLISGIISILCSFFIFAHPDTIMGIVAVMLGLFVIFTGFMAMRWSVILAPMGYKNWWLILIASIVFTLCGVIILFNPMNSSDVLMIFIGIVLAAESIANFVGLKKYPTFSGMSMMLSTMRCPMTIPELTIIRHQQIRPISRTITAMML